MEWYKVLVLFILAFFFIVATITDGFDCFTDDDDINDGGIHT